MINSCDNMMITGWPCFFAVQQRQDFWTTGPFQHLSNKVECSHHHGHIHQQKHDHDGHHDDQDHDNDQGSDCCTHDPQPHPTDSTFSCRRSWTQSDGWAQVMVIIFCDNCDDEMKCDDDNNNFDYPVGVLRRRLYQ